MYYSQKTNENNETPLLRGYSLWRRAFAKENAPCPNRILTMDTRKLNFDFSKAPKGYGIDLNMNLLTAANQKIILQQKVDLQHSELYVLIKKFDSQNDIQSIKNIYARLFAFQDQLFLKKGIMDVDLWVLGNYAFENESGIFPIDPGAFRDTRESLGEVLPFLTRNIEKAEKILTGKRLSKGDKASDLYRVSKMIQAVAPLHGKEVSDYYLEQLIQHFQRWQNSLLEKPFVNSKEKKAVETRA